MTGLPTRTAIITGGAKRIGGAITRALAADGWYVLIHCNQSRAEAEALATELGNASVVAVDLANPAAADIIMATCAGLPPARLLVNSASRFVCDRIEDFSRAFAARLPNTLDDPALVVNLLDAKLASLNPDYFTYTLSKIGFEGLTELTARSYAPRLRCVGIAPAVTLVSGPQTRENFEAVHGLNPLGRGVTVDDIVTALRFIIATPTFNAQTIVLDGGQRLLGLPRDVAHMVEK